MGPATGNNGSGWKLAPTGGAEFRAGVTEGTSPLISGNGSEVRAAEQARIARELDDTVSKSLLGVSMVAASLASAQCRADPQELDERLHELIRLARRAVRAARCAVDDLRGEALCDEVRCVVTAWGILAGINVRLDLAPGSDAPADVRREILAILREALRNVERHAHACTMHACLRRSGDLLLLSVEDDGVGFRSPADLARLPAATGGGLGEMNKRTRRLHGALIVESWPGRGTRLRAQIHAPARDRPRQRALPAASQTSVIIADRNPALRLGLRAALEREVAIRVVAEANNGEDTLALVRSHHPDVLLLDLGMPLPGGPAAISHVSEFTRAVMLTCADDIGLVRRAVAAGASVCVMRGELEPGELIQVVMDAAGPRPITERQAQADDSSSPLSDADRAIPGVMGLRPRELEVMGLIADGLSNREIAARLVITEKTVKNHICSIYQSFGVSERSQAVRRWREIWSISDPSAGMSG